MPESITRLAPGLQRVGFPDGVFDRALWGQASRPPKRKPRSGGTRGFRSGRSRRLGESVVVLSIERTTRPRVPVRDLRSWAALRYVFGSASRRMGWAPGSTG